MNKPKVIVFASCSKDGGGSGFENLTLESRTNPRVNLEVAAVVSNHKDGGVRQKADRLNVPFIHFPGPFGAEEYQRIVKESGAKWVALSGWLKLAKGLDPACTINIHPGPLPEFGGAGMYGHHVHDAVIDAYGRGELTNSAVTMHFVTENYDEGPTLFKISVPIDDEDTTESLAERVNKAEHEWQPIITSLVVNGKISWDGRNPKSLKLPKDYRHI